MVLLLFIMPVIFYFVSYITHCLTICSYFYSNFHSYNQYMAKYVLCILIQSKTHKKSVFAYHLTWMNTLFPKEIEFEPNFCKFTTLCDKACQWLVTGLWFSPCTMVPPTNKIDIHDTTEMLLKVALSTHNPNAIQMI
jgi:hypothetical protein